MHIFFSGIGGTGLGPLALIAQQAGFEVSGSDKQDSQYIHYLATKGIREIHIGQSYEAIAELHARHPIDWMVYTTAVTSEQAQPPELQFCEAHGIRVSRRDELLNHILTEKNLKLIAIAGTHGKTTTTAMMIWLLQHLNMPLSYSVGAKIPFGDMGTWQEGSEYFVYEADEYARNFLAFSPFMALVTGVDWDHPDVYPTREEYDQAFRQFLTQTERAILWQSDVDRLALPAIPQHQVLADDADMLSQFHLPGLVNRRNALQVVTAARALTNEPAETLIDIMNTFPGISRRFEQLVPNLYTDYAHTVPKIRGALQTAREIAGANLVVVYEGLHNTRQHFIKEDLVHLFDDVKQLYIVPSYLAREDPSLPLLSPDDLCNMLSITAQNHTHAAQLDDTLKQRIQSHLALGDVVLCLTAGGGNSLDEWLRREFVDVRAA